ncbi:fused MFS/spermidine synthase [Verrucomicrobiota bacterium]
MSRSRAVVLIVFFVTGVCALVYEVVAARLFRLIMGNTTYAVTTVLCAFMGGLAMGSVIGGRLAEQRKDLLRLFTVFQVIIAVYFFVLPLMMEGVEYLYGGIYRVFSPSFTVFISIQFLFCVLLLLIPCVLMGATLPLLSRFCAAVPEKVGRSTGFLYSVNTIGGALGAWLAGFVLMPLFGVRMTLWLACGLGGFVSVIGYLYCRRLSDMPTISVNNKLFIKETDYQKEDSLRWNRTILLTGYGLAGAAALIYEIAWTRVLCMFIGSSVYAFSLILTVFILGLGMGSIVFARFVSGFRKPVLVLTVIQWAVGFLALLVVPFIDNLPFVVTQLMSRFKGSFVQLQIAEFAVVSFIMLIPTFLMGAVFPVISHIFASLDRTTGRSVGTICAANTAGCVLGTFVGGFCLIPCLGIQGAIFAAVFMNILFGCALLFVMPQITIRRRLLISAAVIGLCVIGQVAIPKWDVSRMTFGPYVQVRKLSDEIIASKTFLQKEAEKHELIFHKEGISATVTVRETEKGERVLFINGKPDASSSADLPTQIMVAHVPLLLHPHPERVLVVGLASGITLGSTLRHPVKTLDCVEISPEILKVCSYFDKHNYGAMNDPRLNIIIQDGRNHMSFTDKKYDVIISEPSNPWISGISDLYTREFFELCRERLTDQGVVCVWLESYTINKDNFQSIITTFRSVFPEMNLWSPKAWDYVLIGAKDGFSVDYGEFCERISAPSVLSDFGRIGIRSVPDFLGDLVMGRNGVKRIAAGASIHTDDNALLEFSNPRTVVQDYQRRDLIGLLEENRNMDLGFLKVSDKDRKPFEDMQVEVEKRIRARGYVVLGSVLIGEGRHNEGMAKLKKGALLNREDRSLQKILNQYLSGAARLIQKNDYMSALAMYQQVEDVDSGNAQAQYGLGFIMEEQKRFLDAFMHYSRAVRLNPEKEYYRIALSGMAYRLGKVKTAVKNYRHILEINPDSAGVMHNLAWILATSKDPEIYNIQEAVRLAEKACEVTGGRDPRMLDTLKKIRMRITKPQ